MWLHHVDQLNQAGCTAHRGCVFTLDVWQVFLVLVHFAAVNGEGQAFEQHCPLLQLSISVGEQAQRTALGNSHSGYREAQIVIISYLAAERAACVFGVEI